MTFLNRKEEVLDIELTQYGKYLLSKGQLKPVYYAFYDDDILYDSEYAGFIEDQNESEDRIKESPRTTVQYLFGGAETAIFTNNQGQELELMPGIHGKKKNRPKVQSKPDKLRSPQLPLGTSDSNSQYIPAWNINFLNGELLSCSTVLSSSAYVPAGKKIPIQPIPQINTEIDYKKWIYDRGANQSDLDKFSDVDFISDKFADNSVLVIEKDYLLLRIEEENGLFERENFDIEFFEVFEKKDDDGAIISTEEQSLLFLEDIAAEPQEDHVDYFFDIAFDSDIEPEILCKGIEKLKVKNVFIDEEFDCSSINEKISKNIYVDTNEFEETCD